MKEKICAFFKCIFVKILKIICNFFITLFCPFFVISREPRFVFWLIFSLLLAPLGSWILLFNQPWSDVIQSFSNIMVLTISLSILTPFVIEFILDSIIEKRAELNHEFIEYKNTSCIIAILFIIFISVFFTTKDESIFKFNFYFLICTIIFAFYMYCISRMSFFPDLKDYESITYKESRELKQLKKKSEKIRTVPTPNGEAKV